MSSSTMPLTMVLSTFVCVTLFSTVFVTVTAAQVENTQPKIETRVGQLLSFPHTTCGRLLALHPVLSEIEVGGREEGDTVRVEKEEMERREVNGTKVRQAMSEAVSTQSGMSGMHPGSVEEVKTRLAEMIVTHQSERVASFKWKAEVLKSSLNEVRVRATHASEKGHAADLRRGEVEAGVKSGAEKGGQVQSAFLTSPLFSITTYSYLNQAYEWNTTVSPTPPCPMWSSSIHSIACTDMAGQARYMYDCSRARPLPFVLRSTNVTMSALLSSPSTHLHSRPLPTSSSSDADAVQMYCLDEGGVTEPGFTYACSLPLFNVSEKCEVCMRGYFASSSTRTCQPCPLLCMQRGVCTDQGGGTPSTCTCDWPYTGSACTSVRYELTSILRAPDGQSGDQLGFNGEAGVSGDGGVVMASAPYASHNGFTNVGKVYTWVWNEAEANYTFVSNRTMPGWADNDQFGFGGVTISSSGGIALVPARYVNVPFSDVGSITVYVHNTSSPFYFDYADTLKRPDAQVGEQLGYGGVTLSADNSTLAAAFGYSSSTYLREGAVAVWRWEVETSTFGFVQILYLPNGTSNEDNYKLGHGFPGVSHNGGIVAASSPYDNEIGQTSGAVHVWLRNSSMLYTYHQRLTAYDGVANDYFGIAGCSMSGTDPPLLVVSAHWDDDGGSSTGSLYIYRWNHTMLEFTFLQKVSGLVSGDTLGYGGPSISVDGRVVGAGAYGADRMGESNTGLVYVWEWRDDLDRFEFKQELLPDEAVVTATTADYFLGRGKVGFSYDGSVITAAAGGDGEDAGAVYVWREVVV
uniref:EGF-like domain-containing protein n=1 Tax=Palpitomonas bilix TaxID=652834 RepID=A0A7S3GEU9_9EUKA|mmetsp:Transcript_46469/g.119922  ORF Transcript_46469/g.119922 Transcript_46469/m.119922 type:complete len:802 (+) Transcript_46469:298-2703(+)